MRRKAVEIVLLALMPLVGAIALPAQASFEAAAAELQRAGDQSVPADQPGGEDSSKPSPPVLVIPHHWTVEKQSRQSEVPDLELRIIGKHPHTPCVDPSWRLSRHDPQANAPRVLVAHPFLIRLIGAQAPPAVSKTAIQAA